LLGNSEKGPKNWESKLKTVVSIARMINHISRVSSPAISVKRSTATTTVLSVMLYWGGCRISTGIKQKEFIRD